MMSKQKMILNLQDKKLYMKVVIVLFVFFLFQSCNKENKQEIQSKENYPLQEKKLKTMNDILEKQLKEGASQYALDDDGNSVSETLKHSFSIDELNTCTVVISEILKSNGYKAPSDIDFNNKINKIFGRLINPNSLNKYLYINYYNKCDKEFCNQSNDGVNFNGTYIIKNKNFITDFFYLPELINYQEKFPNIAQLEKKYPSEWYNDELKMKVGIEKWMEFEARKDDYNLSKARNFNKLLIISRNKYLFNDNKASLVWLKFNDQYFLESLVKVFGYVQDKDLLKWVLDRNLNDDEFDKLIFTKTCENKYIFHKEIFEVMTEADERTKEKYIMFLRGKTELPKVEDANFSDKARIYALYCYYATKFTQSIDQGYVYTFFPKLNDEKFEEEFKRNNYYNIPDFKKLFEDTKNGGIGLPM
jgi:hypothetical protein